MTIVPPRTGRRSLVRALTAMLAAIAVWSILPAAAQAAFPGTNGKLAFGSARSGFPADNDLYTMDADGTAQTRITSLNQDELYPAWSAERHQDRVRAQHRPALRHLGRERRRLERACS